jgi:hypothetical protein
MGPSTVGVHEVGGRAAVAEYVPQMIGLKLAEGKHRRGSFSAIFG